MINSLGLTMPSETFVVTPPALSADGTFVVTWHSQVPGTFHRGPYSGSGPPIWGVILSTDIPPLPASIITSGQFSVAQIPNLPASIITSGTLPLPAIPPLPASQVTSGTFIVPLIPTLPAATALSGTLPVGNIPSLPAGQITSGVFATAQIPSLPASQITSGTFSTSLIPTLPAATALSGTLPLGNIPGLPGSQITSGTIGSAYLPSSVPDWTNLSPTVPLVLGSFVTIATLTSSNTILGMFGLFNTGTSEIQYQFLITDKFGTTVTVGPMACFAGSKVGAVLENQIQAPAFGPVTQIVIQLKLFSAGTGTYTSYITALT
jgi:hypothetical protein